MRMLKKRKPRGIKLNGEPSLDMCTCYSFYCDPMTVSSKFSQKIDKRIKLGVHPPCGTTPCSCKSSSALPKRPKYVDMVPGEMTEELVRAIRIDQEKTYQEWADILGLPKQEIYNIKKFKTWRHVKP